MSFHSTTFAWPAETLLMHFWWKCSTDSTERAKICGPLTTATHISAFIHSCPVTAVHPNDAYFCRRGAAGWLRAYPLRHILPRCSGGGSTSWLIKWSPPWLVQHDRSRCCYCRVFCTALFSWQCCQLLPRMGVSLSKSVGLQRPPCSCSAQTPSLLGIYADILSPVVIALKKSYLCHACLLMEGISLLASCGPCPLLYLWFWLLWRYQWIC